MWFLLAAWKRAWIWICGLYLTFRPALLLRVEKDETYCSALPGDQIPCGALNKFNRGTVYRHIKT